MKNLDNLETALTYDDIQLRPLYSEVESRSDVDLSTKFTRNYNIKIPIVAAPMDTVCGRDMAVKMMKLGGVGVIHRFMPATEQASIARELRKLREDDYYPIAGAIGLSDFEISRAQYLLDAGCNVILIDVAHGHHVKVKRQMDILNNLRKTRTFDVVVGSITTAGAVEDVVSWGADAVRVGTGNGATCSTRIQTGHGIPSISAIIETVEAAEKYDVPVIADGGIRSSGDIAKALAVGADSVMLGSLLAGTNETPGDVIEKENHLYKEYRGLASLETKREHKQEKKNIEGVSAVIPYKGGVKFVIRKLVDGTQSAFSYTGAHNMQEYQQKAEIVRVTRSGVVEASPHILNK